MTHHDLSYGSIHSRPIKLILAIGSVLALSACGGGGDGSDASGGSDTATTSSQDTVVGGDQVVQTTQTGDPVKGFFSEPFAEPTIMVDGEAVETDEKCITREDGTDECKPAAGTMALLRDGRLLYLNALEGTENVELSIVKEFGEVSVNDQSRVLALDDNDTPSWLKPSPLDAGANPDGNDSETLLDGTELDGLLSTADDTSKNDGALFCSDVVGLANGDVMAVGGTDYYTEAGLVELEGIKNSRIFEEANNTWSQSGDMTYGRWYPSVITLGNSNLFVASGVTKLIKPVYPEDPLNSGRNVVQTETYNPCTGTWTQNPSTADRSLPLYPRMHLLPNGHVFYNAGGQAFNPFGQGYDQALWNIAASFNPETQTWTDIGYAGLPLRLDEAGLAELSSTLNITNASMEQVSSLLGGVIESPSDLMESGADLDITEEDLQMALAGGMRGSTSSTMLPLKPNADGTYTDVELLTAGGVPSYALLTNPGGYLPTDQSRIDRISTNGDEIDYESRLTGPLNQPRWYGTNVLMPDGSVMVFSGGDRDGVAAPGLEGPIRTAERFDPETSTWTEMAMANRSRTYHNTAVLMEDGRVMIGGHSPINTAYLTFVDLQDFGLAPYDGRDPSFEIYTPPYAMRDDRPVIKSAPRNLTIGDRFNVKVDQADAIDKALLIRRTVMTHVIDSDQRAIELVIEQHPGNMLTLTMPDNHNVVPAGEYMLFVSKDTEQGRVPSESAPITVVNESLACMAPADGSDSTITTADGIIESTLEIL